MFQSFLSLISLSSKVSSDLSATEMVGLNFAQIHRIVHGAEM